MARVVVMCAGLGGVACAYEMKKKLGKAHEVTLVPTGAPKTGYMIESLKSK